MTRIPSRYMPKYIQSPTSLRTKVIGYFFLLLFIAWLLSALWKHPKEGFSILAFILISFFIDIIYQNRRLKKLASKRVGEDIGTFARSFDHRKIDTWVIRAVHEEMLAYMTFLDGVCPIRASDKVLEVLRMEEDDIEDIIEIVLQRTGHTNENMEENPYYGKIETIKDLVLFLDAQPKLA